MSLGVFLINDDDIVLADFTAALASITWIKNTDATNYNIFTKKT